MSIDFFSSSFSHRSIVIFLLLFLQRKIRCSEEEKVAMINDYIYLYLSLYENQVMRDKIVESIGTGQISTDENRSREQQQQHRGIFC